MEKFRPAITRPIILEKFDGDPVRPKGKTQNSKLPLLSERPFYVCPWGVVLPDGTPLLSPEC